jgi:hypothetical protein
MTDDKIKYICVSTVRKEYKLNDDDLKEIECKYVRNPRYRCAPEMRLYVEDEVKKLAKNIEKKKELERQYNIEHADEILSKKLEEKKKKQDEKRKEKKKEQDEKKTLVKNFTSNTISIEYGSTNLPNEILMLIMNKVIDTYEPNGIRGPSIIAQEIINIGLSCKDFYNILKYGLETLSNIMNIMNINQINWDLLDWDKLIKNPNSAKLPILKTAARELELKVSGTKAELIIRILEQFGTDKPINCPAKLAFGLECERCQGVNSRISRIIETMHIISIRVLPDYNAREINRILVDKFDNFENMYEQYNIRVKENARKAREELDKSIKKMEERRKELIELKKNLPINSNRCVCGQIYAKDCSSQLCGTCCRTTDIDCDKHKHKVHKIKNMK